ncbi:hypothetical protein [Nocardioides aurantiacus]|uniref:Uncharacterized protein n=1 Tax=Nocardioides aurantiacus TaxID=86796 RepID=A0A3N2CYE1_9ACTN|nr:hypothetical protein [Nocardioides aurantiacus]ROR92551.1 hypothetical protein EDD33_3442 [Nocardioides aurantiacus]
MSELGLELNALRAGSRDWTEVADRMSTTAELFEQTSSMSLGDSVRASAADFLDAWAGYAQESADIATGFSGALTAAADRYGETDDASGQGFSDLDGRLGPAR